MMSKKPEIEQIPEKEEQTGGVLIWLLLGILLVMLLGGGFALASYLGYISFDGLAEKAQQVKKIPIVAKYFPPQKPTGSEVENLEPTEEQPEADSTKPVAEPPKQTVPAPAQPVNAAVTAAKDAQALGGKAPANAAKSNDEAKNVSRLARLYGTMKPEEAVPILQQLEDDLVVNIIRKMEDDQAAKVLAGMEPQRAAKLTRLLYK